MLDENVLVGHISIFVRENVQHYIRRSGNWSFPEATMEKGKSHFAKWTLLTQMIWGKYAFINVQNRSPPLWVEPAKYDLYAIESHKSIILSLLHARVCWRCNWQIKWREMKCHLSQSVVRCWRSQDTKHTTLANIAHCTD